MAEDWQNAYDSSQQSQDQLAAMQEGPSRSGLLGLAGFMLVAGLGPAALKKGARTAIGRLGNSAAGRSASVGLRSAVSSAGATTQKQKIRALAGAVRSARGSQRIISAAAAEVQTGGRVNLSRFAANIGFDAPQRLTNASRPWRNFKKSPSVKKGGLIKSFRASPNQQKLARSAMAEFARDQMTMLPLTYGLDTYTGFMSGAGEAPAWYDVPGHVENFTKWLPTYIGMDIASRGAMMLPGLAKGLIQKSKGALADNTKAAGAVSRTYDGITRMRRQAQIIGEEARNAYETRVRKSSNPAKEALMQARVVGQRSKTRSQNLHKMGKPEYDLHTDESLSGALGAFMGGVAGKGKGALHTIIKDGRSDTAEAAAKKLYQNMFVQDGEKHKSFLGKLFNAEAVTLKEVEHLGTQDAKRQLAQLRTRISRVKGLSAGQYKKGKVSGAINDTIQSSDADQLRVHGFAKVGGKILRMPTGQDVRSLAGSIMRRMSHVYVPGSRQGFNLYNFFQGDTIMGRRPDTAMLSGGTEVTGRYRYFGKYKDAPINARATGDAYKSGFAVSQAPGALSGDVYGYKHGELHKLNETPELFLRGRSKILRTAMSKHYEPDSVMSEEERYLDETYGTKSTPLGRFKSWLQLGEGGQHAYNKLRGIAGSHNPRNVFKPGSAVYKPLHNLTPADSTQMADAINSLQIARIRASDVYARPELFGEALDSLLSPTVINDTLGGVDEILRNDRKAYEAAREVMNNVATSKSGTLARSPTYAHARKLLLEIEADPNALYSPQGTPAAQTLRRFVFEEGVLGLHKGATGTKGLVGKLDDLTKRGAVTADAAAEAKAGLMYLDLVNSVPKLPSNPYELLKGGVKPNTVPAFKELSLIAEVYEKDLQQFARSKHRVEPGYGRGAYLEADMAGAPVQEAGMLSVRPDPGAMLGLYVKGGLDTTREALGFAGLGWNPRSKLGWGDAKNPGVGRLWARRSGVLAAASLGYGLADTSADILVPEDMPLGEGISMELANAAANARLAASSAYDFLGISDAASYMEGLMPKSMSTLPGAALGFFAGGWKGALTGAVLNRMTTETLKDTPFEALSINPLFAPFVSDLAESSEDTRAKYEGEQWVPVRKGRFFLLSSGDYSGSRIESWRPNWYTLQKADTAASPVLYGSKFEELIFKDLPIIDASIGDIFDPQYLQKKQYTDRPYVAPDLVGKDIPLIGPQVGRTFGAMYNALHPMASNDLMHTQDVTDLYGGLQEIAGPATGTATAGTALLGGPQTGVSAISGYDVYQESPTGNGAAFLATDTIVTADSARASVDEQFYRLTEAMGFAGFMGQQMVGGEGVFRDSVLESASQMDSTGRAFHDLGMGDLLGFGEAMRRLYPFQRNATRYGPKNTMPNWMPDEFQQGDPYCLLPDTLIEVDGRMIRAEDAYEKHQQLDSNTSIYGTTHRSRYRKITETAVRDVNESIVSIETKYSKLLNNLDVTKAHPVLVLDKTTLDKKTPRAKWILAGDLKVGDIMLRPAEVYHDNIRTSRSFDQEQKDPREVKRKLPQTWYTMQALLSLLEVKLNKSGYYVCENPIEGRVYDRAFGLPGSPAKQRRLAEITNLARRLQDSEGLPACLVGMPITGLKALVDTWGVYDDQEIKITITIPEYVPDKDNVAYILSNAFSYAETPCEIVDNSTLILRDNSALAYQYSAVDIAVINKAKDFGTNLDDLIKIDIEHTEKGHVFRDLYEKVPVLSIEEREYTGPVYAFEIEEDATFVAAGVVTHNSKIAMGEALLPGAGFDAVGGLRTAGDRELSVAEIGEDAYSTALNMLGIQDVKQGLSWSEAQTAKSLIDAGTAVRQEAVFVDEASRVVSVAAAATKGGNPIHIEALQDAEFNQIASRQGVRSLDREKINASLGAAKRAKGYVAYVNESTGQVSTYVHQFDSGLYNKTVTKLQQARTLAKEYAAQGYGSPGAMYNTVDRLRVLLNADPFGSEWRVEMRKAKALASSGAMDTGELTQFTDIVQMHDKMGLPFEIYQDRFAPDQIMNPDPYYTNLTFNDHIQAASEYTLPERLVGSVWERFSNMRTPLHSKFFGAYNLENQYERQVLLNRGFQSWEEPFDDFLMPYMRGVVASTDPLQGAASLGVGGAMFGGPVWGAVGTVAGSLYGAIHGSYRKLTDSAYVPQEVVENREVQQGFDRLQYYRAKRLYDATGSQQYLDEMQASAYGWTQSGLSKSGWAKERRYNNNPAASFSDPYSVGGYGYIYNSDQGFGSPWKGLLSLAKRAKQAASNKIYGPPVPSKLIPRRRRLLAHKKDDLDMRYLQGRATNRLYSSKSSKVGHTLNSAAQRFQFDTAEVAFIAELPMMARRVRNYVGRGIESTTFQSMSGRSVSKLQRSNITKQSLNDGGGHRVFDLPTIYRRNLSSRLEVSKQPYTKALREDVDRAFVAEYEGVFKIIGQDPWDWSPRQVGRIGGPDSNKIRLFDYGAVSPAEVMEDWGTLLMEVPGLNLKARKEVLKMFGASDDLVKKAFMGEGATPIPTHMQELRDKVIYGQVKLSGLMEKGLSSETRKLITQHANRSSDLGFGSPYRGNDPFAAIMWHGNGMYFDPTMGDMPPEMLSAYKAAPSGEKDFYRALMLLQDPRDQAKMLKRLSPDMAAMMDVSWSYMYGQSRHGYAVSQDPMAHLDMPLDAHPVMGMGAYMEGYQIRTMTDMGLDVKDAGLGWKNQMARLNTAIVDPTSISSIMSGPGMTSAPPMRSDVRQQLHTIITSTLAQMGIFAQVDIGSTGGPTEIHFIQSVG